MRDPRWARGWRWRRAQRSAAPGRRYERAAPFSDFREIGRLRRNALRSEADCCRCSYLPLTWAEPHRGVVEHGAAARQTGVGAGHQIDPDPLLESMVGPQPFDNHYTLLQAVKGSRMDDDAAALVADAHALAVAEAEISQRLRMDERRRPSLAGDARRGVVEAGVEEGSR